MSNQYGITIHRRRNKGSRAIINRTPHQIRLDLIRSLDAKRRVKA